MGLTKQPDEYSCGPTCVSNALYLLGNAEVSFEQIKQACGTRWWNGTDESGLRRALRRLGYEGLEAQWPHKADRKAALAWLREQHGLNHPVILCVDNFDHWVLAAGSTEKAIIVLDPYGGHRGATTSSYSRTKLADRWWSVDKEKKEGGYYGMAVIPRTKNAKRLAVSAIPLTSPEVLNRLKDTSNDLLPVSHSLIDVFGRVRKGKQLAELLSEYSPYLVDRIDYWWAGIDRARIRQELRNFVAFARGRQLRYVPARREQVLMDIAVLLVLHTYYKPEELMAQTEN
ncbi:MAG: hypothetical protein ALAOOOJD_02328 [bacterium]|nr:hypothetical protein [bacterium]